MLTRIKQLLLGLFTGALVLGVIWALSVIYRYRLDQQSMRPDSCTFSGNNSSLKMACTDDACFVCMLGWETQYGEHTVCQWIDPSECAR